jgi:very-short-patch-repair endonuclease
LSRKKLITSVYHLPYNPELTKRAQELRKRMTEPELKLWFRVLKHTGFRVLRQKVIDNFIVDFYIPKLRLVIEVDGDSHYMENRSIYDKERDEILTGYGLKVIRLTNRDIIENIEGVAEFLRKIMKSPHPPLLRGDKRGDGN